MKSIYICHPFSDNPEHNIIAVRRICRAIVDNGEGLPLAPHLLFPPFIDDITERDMAMVLCMAMLSMCDVIYVYGDYISAGMKVEIEEALRLGIPCEHKEARS